MDFAPEFVTGLLVADAPEEPDPQTLQALITRYAIDVTARNELVLQLAFPVYHLAARFRSRNNADDILGEAMLSLVECVDRWFEVSVDGDIRRYVEFSVKKRIKDWIDNDRVMGMPSRRVREKRAEGEEIEQPVPVQSEQEPAVPCDTSFDVQEFFRSCVDERDRMLIEMKLNGRRVPEIAKAVGQKKSWVYKRLRDLEKAYDYV